MRVKYYDNTAKVKAETQKKASSFLRLMLEEAQRESVAGTPKKTGDLRASTVKVVNGLKGKLMWTKHYAAIQETKKFKNYTTAGTGRHYAKNAIEKTLKKQKEIFKRA